MGTPPPFGTHYNRALSHCNVFFGPGLPAGRQAKKLDLGEAHVIIAAL